MKLFLFYLLTSKAFTAPSMAELLLNLSSTAAFFLTVLSLTSSFATIESKTFSRDLSPSSMGLNKPEKLSHLHFYFHDIVAGKNATAIRVAKAPTTTVSLPFGAVVVIDDALTVSPDIDSKLVGRAQGIYVTSSQSEASLLMAYNFAFMEGMYSGSSLTVMGRNPVFSDVREMPVIGGSGVFRFARGYAEARTSTYDYNTGNAVVEYNVYVLHPDSPVQISNALSPNYRKKMSQFLCIFILYFLILKV